MRHGPEGSPFAWTGAALFAASLGYFLFSYAVTFRAVAEAGTAPRAAAIDAALFALFALHHSVFARPAVRAWVARTLSPEHERAAFVWMASVMLIAVCAFWQPLPGVAWDLGRAGPAVTVAGWALGLWLTLRSAAIIDVWDLAGLRPPPVANSTAAIEELRVDGPYGMVRHPIYLGWLLLVFSVSPMTTTRLLFAAVSTCYLLVAIPLEERTLRAATGDAYDRYRRRVRWKLIPGVY
jgi:protein-S-isoprenylcysteine O-methyltransferase Ste14